MLGLCAADLGCVVVVTAIATLTGWAGCRFLTIVIKMNQATRSNQYGKLRWCTERRRVVVEFWLLLALALIVRNLIRRAWTTQRWNTRPSRRP
jgi:hypothetical protein